MGRAMAMRCLTSRTREVKMVPVYAVLYRDTVSIHLLRRDDAPHGLAAPVQAQSAWEAGDNWNDDSVALARVLG